MDNKISINGHEFEVVGYFKLESGDFVVYTDGSLLSNGEVALFVNSVITDENGVTFGDVTEEETKEVLSALEGRLREDV